jgi:hypothetical protein
MSLAPATRSFGGDRSEQRFDGEEPNVSGSATQMVDAPRVVGVLHADPKPDIRGGGVPHRERFEPLGALREDMEPMLRRLPHHPEHLLDVRVGYVLVRHSMKTSPKCASIAKSPERGKRDRDGDASLKRSGNRFNWRDERSGWCDNGDLRQGGRRE